MLYLLQEDDTTVPTSPTTTTPVTTSSSSSSDNVTLLLPLLKEDKESENEEREVKYDVHFSVPFILSDSEPYSIVTTATSHNKQVSQSVTQSYN